VQPPHFEPLGGEQQMDAQRPADPSHCVEQIDELGFCGQQLAEVVDHDEQRR